ncbi:MAG: OmpA family protein, partial [Cellulomonadaceae bacterium]|nr:OmpA family protein [Cellulomonadaceae bacterium]
FFSPASADLTETALRVLDGMAPVLNGLSEQISVEGNTNSLPVTGQYATNWELSADRATKVLRRLVEVGGMPPNRIAAVGYADSRPLDDASQDPMSANRRVDIVVVSPVPESVRAYLPTVAAESQG